MCEVIANCTPTVAVLICSSDSRRDVLERVLPSLLKYWPDCPYPVYVGLNTKYSVGANITTLVANPSNWRTECLEQLAQMSETHVIVVLDDFLFQKPVDQNRVSALLSAAVESNLPYLRLVPLGRSLLERLRDLIRTRPRADFQAIRAGRPFISSLQIAIWNKTHFCSLLKSGSGSIWDFEHQARSGATHYAITGYPPIAYNHLVEKGRWQPYANSLLRQAGLPGELGTRPVWPKWTNLRVFFDKVRFHFFGYANY